MWKCEIPRRFEWLVDGMWMQGLLSCSVLGIGPFFFFSDMAMLSLSVGLVISGLVVDLISVVSEL